MPFPSPGDLPDPGIEPRSPALWADTLTSTELQHHIFSFMDYAFDAVSKNPLPNQRSPRSVSLFSSRRFLVSCFTSRCMILHVGDRE